MCSCRIEISNSRDWNLTREETCLVHSQIPTRTVRFPYRTSTGMIEYFSPTFSLRKFREANVSPGKTEVKQDKFEFIFPAKGYLRETYKSQNINPISPTSKFTLGSIQIKVKSLSTSFQDLVQ